MVEGRKGGKLGDLFLKHVSRLKIAVSNGKRYLREVPYPNKISNLKVGF